jgi:hypothetical protein
VKGPVTPCAWCGWSRHATVVAGSRFRSTTLVTLYRGDFPGAPERGTREEAAHDLCLWRIATGRAVTP